MDKEQLAIIVNHPHANTFVVVDHDCKMWDIAGALVLNGVAQIQLMELITDDQQE